jgi:hypothetical protein
VCVPVVRDEAIHARSTPAENAFPKAEETTTTRTVGSSAIRSNAAPYSSQYLVCNRVSKDLATERRSTVLRPSDFAYSPFIAFTGGLLWGYSHQDQRLVW